jgi:hypothetical protein
MRSLILVSSILTVALVSAAQSAQARSDTPAASGISKQTPEQYRYRPCPADVVFANGQHACLG